MPESALLLKRPNGPYLEPFTAQKQGPSGLARITKLAGGRWKMGSVGRVGRTWKQWVGVAAVPSVLFVAPGLSIAGGPDPGGDVTDGWDDLEAAARGADVVFLGEWHGAAENAGVARRLLAAVPFDVLALEIGVEAGAEVDALLRREGLPGLREEFRR